MRDDRLLTPGETCWRVARADQFACIIDAADYFRHVKAAMLRAQHRIMLIGWDFDARMTFERGAKDASGAQPARRLPLLDAVEAADSRDLPVEVQPAPASGVRWHLVRAHPGGVLNQFTSKRMHFAIDGAHPTGAVHHQKIAVIDDSVAFCGGIDLTVDRWDTPAHEHDSRSRRTVGRSYGPRHEVGGSGRRCGRARTR